MDKREELNKLVFFVLKNDEISGNLPTARELYKEIRDKEPRVLKEEHVRGFRSFVKIINAFPDIQGNGYTPKVYKTIDLNIKKDVK